MKERSSNKRLLIAVFFLCTLMSGVGCKNRNEVHEVSQLTQENQPITTTEQMIEVPVKGGHLPLSILGFKSMEDLLAIKQDLSVENPEEWLPITFGSNEGLFVKKDGTKLISLPKMSGYQPTYFTSDAIMWHDEYQIHFTDDGQVILYNNQKMILYIVRKEGTVDILSDDIRSVANLSYSEGVLYVVGALDNDVYWLISMNCANGIYENIDQIQGRFQVVGNKVYYILQSKEGCAIKSYDVESKKSVVIVNFSLEQNVYSDSIMILDDFLYCKVGTDFVKMTMDGEVITRYKDSPYVYDFQTDGEWIYFSQYGLYKMDSDFNNLQLLYSWEDQQPHLLRTQDNVLAITGNFVDTYSYPFKENPYGFYGVNESPLQVPVLQMLAEKNRLYYINAQDYFIYETDPSLSSSTCLLSQPVHEFALDNGVIYYTLFEEMNNLQLWRMNLDGTNKEMLVEGGCEMLQVKDGYVYYKNRLDAGKLYRVSLTVKKKELVMEHIAGTYQVFEGGIYYQDILGKGYLNFYNPSTKKNSCVVSTFVEFIRTDGQDLYVQVFSGGSYLLKLEKGGFVFQGFMNFVNDILFYEGKELVLFIGEGDYNIYEMDLGAVETIPLIYEDDRYGYVVNFNWMHTNYLYRIDKKTMAIEQVFKESFSEFTVDGDYLFYGNDYDNGFIRYLDFTNGEIKEIKPNTMQLVDRYEFMVNDGKVYYHSISAEDAIHVYSVMDHKNIALEGSEQCDSILSVKDDCIVYGGENSSYTRYDLETGETHELFKPQEVSAIGIVGNLIVYSYCDGSGGYYYANIYNPVEEVFPREDSLEVYIYDGILFELDRENEKIYVFQNLLDPAIMIQVERDAGFDEVIQSYKYPHSIAIN